MVQREQASCQSDAYVDVRAAGEMRGIIVYRVWCGAAVLLTVTGCMVTPSPVTKEEIQGRVSQDLRALLHEQEPIEKPIDFYEATARALRYNLDAKVKAMQSALAHQQLNVAHYSLLPQVAVNAGFDGRNNFAGGGAQSLVDGRPILEPFTSMDKNVFSGNLSLSWDVLDFGLSYIRAKQAGDNMLIAEEERRRIAVRLLQDVRNAYWRAVSAERLLPQVQQLDRMIDKALSQSQSIVERKLQAPLTPLNYRRDMLNIQREVHKLLRELSTAKIQLASLMGLPPGVSFEVHQPSRQGAPVLDTLDADGLEQQALLFRPELRTIDYQKRINAKEAKATLLELFPSMKLQFGGYYNSNSFFLYQNWLNYAAQVSWNMMGVFRVPAKYKAIEAQRAVLDAQSLALTMTVLTEVHVGAAQLMLAKDELGNARTYQETQQAIVEHTHSLWITNNTSELVLLREQVNQILAEVRLDVAQAGVETAYATLRSAVGEEAVPPSGPEQTLSGLADSLRQLWEPTPGGVSGSSRERQNDAIPVAQ
ncbi:MAG TPA: TolC family protein [Nitrospira sp.]|nr:TolC family protein [Nitrospira sp.]